jgi:two-component system copper resistance phosphate regulon response regulator CusR
MKRICLVEDEEKVAAFIKQGLIEDEYSVDIAKDGYSGLALLEENKYDLAILDMMLPGINGIEICKKIRLTNPQIPILILTALDSINDKVSGLQAGADDYLVKPFHFSELKARIESLLRRQGIVENSEQFLSFEDLTLNLWSKTAVRANKSIVLTAKEYALLELFLLNPNKLLSRQLIAEKVWKSNFDADTNVIDVYVKFLRNKIEKDFKTKLIHTVIGLGYILKSENN